MPPHIVNFLLGSFGIVAAVVLLGGSVFLRAQQNRYRFELAKKSLETGVPLPLPEPTWKGLHRQAQSILAVGIGLLIVGAVAWGSGANVERPAEVRMQATTAPAPAPAPPPGYRDDGPGDVLGRGTPPPPPPRPSLDVEQWQHAQVRIAIGQTAMGCGVILTLLGLSRRSAAKTEHKTEHLSQPTTIV